MKQKPTFTDKIRCPFCQWEFPTHKKKESHAKDCKYNPHHRSCCTCFYEKGCEISGGVVLKNCEHWVLFEEPNASPF